jgi:hypothetical protein
MSKIGGFSFPAAPLFTANNFFPSFLIGSHNFFLKYWRGKYIGAGGKGEERSNTGTGTSNDSTRCRGCAMEWIRRRAREKKLQFWTGGKRK